MKNPYYKSCKHIHQVETLDEVIDRVWEDRLKRECSANSDRKIWWYSRFRKWQESWRDKVCRMNGCKEFPCTRCKK